MSANQTPSLPTATIPVERFVERLYAPLAWDATVRLGDPAIAARLVERILHRAWDERDRFATFEALNRHVQDAAHTAIRVEADRRRDVTRFDDGPSDAPVPGSLESMSVEAVRQRIGEGRRPNPTPPDVVAVPQPSPVHPAAPGPVAASPVVASPVAASPVEASPVAARPIHKPRLSMATGRASASSARVDLRASSAAPRNGATAARKSAAFTLIPGVDGTPSRFTPTQRGVGIAALVVLVLAGVAAVRAGGPRDPQARAFAALADSTGPSFSAARGAVNEVTLPDGSLAQLGAEGTLATNAGFDARARALRLSGPVMVALKQDSSALVAIQVGEHRFLTAGGVAAFHTGVSGFVSVQVDSGDVLLVRDSSRVRLVAGSLVRIGPGTPVSLTREQRDEAFGWRIGRLQLAGASLETTAAAARQWFDVEVRFPDDRAATDTVSIDVPLASRDSLIDALEQALRARAAVQGNRIVLVPAARSASDRSGGLSAPSAARLAPPGIVIPPIPLDR